MGDSFQERAAAEIRRGVLQVAALALLARPAYGYDLIKVLAERGLQVEEGTLYPILRRLQSAGLLSSSWDTTGKRPRKYYETTDEGKATLAALTEEWDRVDGALRSIIEDPEPHHDDADPPPAA